MTMIVESAAGRRILNGPEKVAALLLALDRPIAEQLLRRFGTEEIRDVARSAADLGRLPAQALDEIVGEFAGHFSNGADILGSAGEAVQLISGVLPPDEVADIVSDLLGSSNESVWTRLEIVREEDFAAYLGKEHPQTAAAILNKIPPGLAGRVLSRLPVALRKSVVHRMLSIKPISAACMRILENGLQEELLSQKSARAGDPSLRFADMLNRMERADMQDMLGVIAEARPDLATAIQGRLFSFEDIVHLSLEARSILFDRVPTDRLVQALTGQEEAFCNEILGSLTLRARRMIEGELRAGAHVTPRDVAAARRFIADLALELADRGQIELHDTAAAA